MQWTALKRWLGRRHRAVGISAGVTLLLLVFWGVACTQRVDLVTTVLREIPPPLLILLAGGTLLYSAIARAWLATAMACVALVIATFPIGGLELQTSHEKTTHSFGVVTYNVEKWTHGGRNIALALSENTPSLSTSANHASAICLQEAGRTYHWMNAREQADAFTENLPDFQFVWAQEIAVGTNLPIISHSETPLPGGPDSRPVLNVVVDVDGQPVSIVSVHFVYTHYFDNSLHRLSQGAAARLQQASFVLDYLRRIPHPVVLCGDLNAPPRALSMQRLRAELNDSWVERGRGFGFTFPTGLLSRRIDYILSRDLDVKNAAVLSTKASDHYPLWVSFETQSSPD